MLFQKIYNNIFQQNSEYILKKFPYFYGNKAYKYSLINNTYRERYSGSIGNIQALNDIKNILIKNNIKFNIDSFIKNTPIGKVKFNNLIVDFPSNISNKYIIIACHHDSKYFPKFNKFSGANDGSSGVGLLLALIEYFNNINESLPIGLKFIFLDGEECYYNYNKNDGLFGSKHAAKLYHKNCKYMILLDMIGAKNLYIKFPKNSNTQLLNMTFNIINNNNYNKYFDTKVTDNKIIDDTTPFEKYKIPTINFIQIDYQHWHTNDDTIDKISLKSLEIIGNTTIQLINAICNYIK